MTARCDEETLSDARECRGEPGNDPERVVELLAVVALQTKTCKSTIMNELGNTEVDLPSHNILRLTGVSPSCSRGGRGIVEDMCYE
jgi:hypothetical protein